MKYLILLLGCLLTQACATSESIFVLSPAQSMSITGQGSGQDAAFNPYGDGNSLAIVKNLGRNVFTIRVQDGDKIVENRSINPNETLEIKLQQGFKLYLDSEQASKAQVNFRKARD
ncbi:MAG: hypothetical protein AB8F95_17010 [Bacteroidia bacterium]